MRGLVTVITNTHIYTWLVNMVITTLVTTPDPIYAPSRYLHNIVLPKLYRYGSDWFRVFLIILIYEYSPWQKCNPVNISISISPYQSSYLWHHFTHFWLERIPLSVADHKIEIFKIFSTYFCFSLRLEILQRGKQFSVKTFLTCYFCGSIILIQVYPSPPSSFLFW